MTAKKAALIAMSNKEFVEHHTAVQTANIQFAFNPNAARSTSCLAFIVDGEYFVYGFDGCEVVLKKASPKATRKFKEYGIGLFIR